MPSPLVRMLVLSSSIWLLAPAGAAAAPARNGTEPPVGLSLQEALRLALQRNPSLAALRAGVAAGDAEVEEAAAARWPRLTAEMGWHRTDHQVLVFGDKLTAAEFAAGDFAIDKLNHPDALNHATAALTLEAPLATSGRLLAAREAARLQAEAGRAALVAAEADLTARVTQAYFDIQLAVAVAGVAASALEDARGHEAIASARFEAGAALRSDQLRAQVARLARERDLDRARAGVEIAKARLRTLLAMDPRAAIEPATPLAPPASDPGDLDDWMSRAASRPEIQQAASAAGAARASVRIARAQLGPEVGGLARYERNANRLDAGDGSYLVGVSLKWSAFDRGRPARVAAAQARADAAEARRSEVEDAARLEVEQAWRDAVVADRGLAVAREAVAAAEEAARITATRYEGGLLPVTDLLDVETALVEARLAQLHATYDAVMGRVLLARAAGASEAIR